MPTPHRTRPPLRALLASVTLAAAGLALLAFPGPAAAAPSLVDVYPGQSIAAAVKTVAAGGTVVVHAGNYPALSLGWLSWTSPVTVRAASGDDVVLAGATLTKLTNFRLAGVRATAVLTVDGGRGIDLVESTLTGVTVKNGATDVDVADNTVTGGWNGVAVVSWNGAPRPRDIRISRNTISGQANDNIQIGIADDVTVEDNDLRDPVANDNHNDGIQFMGGERLLVRRNRFSGQDQAVLLQAEAQLGADNRVSDARLENNLVTATRGAGFIVTATAGTTIVNNTIYDTPYASVHLIGGNTDLTVANNVMRQIWRQSGAAAPTVEDHNCVVTGGTGVNDVKIDPQFVDRIDYRLAATSPCRDLGRLDLAPLDDLDHVLRGALPDAGAREVLG
jgi:parallel beta-helix repeat protein